MKRESSDEACFGAGCFWHVQELFDKTKGIIETEAGYMGGNEKKYPNPSYKDVCSNKTGYVEVVFVRFNPNTISYKELLNIFLNSHDPSQLNRQGLDIGSQYRSVIFYYNTQQKKEALNVIKEYKENLGKEIVTQIIKAKKFFRAEEYHQGYYKKNNLTCGI